MRGEREKSGDVYRCVVCVAGDRASEGLRDCTRV